MPTREDYFPATAPCIGDYAAIGDGRSVALISGNGSLDWLCWPRFDSPSIFCGLLDPDRGGQWVIAPAAIKSRSRRYVGTTNVLETCFETESGTMRLTDFMPIADADFANTHLLPDHEIIRIATCESGTIELEVGFSPRPNFARRNAPIVDRGKLGLRVDTGYGMLSLHSDLQFAIHDQRAIARTTMAAGEERAMILTFSRESPEVLPLLSDASAALERTLYWWNEWAKKFTYTGEFPDAVLRSALTLKLLDFPKSGAFVAAATTSLPERRGGNLNWDYRYCWLRDSSVIISALSGTGFIEEAEGFGEWLLHATRLSQPRLKVMYNVYGNLAPRETPLSHLAGFANSKPVNLGNSARSQTQLDTYGEVVSAAAMMIRRRGSTDRETAKVLARFGTYVCKHWQEPDAGIWETRGKPTIHTHSRLLCWVTLDSLIDLEKHGLLYNYGRDEFVKTRDAIRHAIETESWNEAEQTYVSEPGTTKLDATLLLLAVYGFEPADSERMQATFRRVNSVLGAGGSLLYRNLDQGKPIEGAFGICGFWAVEFLAMGGGSVEEARDAFEKLIGYGNDLGLHAEEVDPTTGEALGNFPQAFTHVGLINAALAIEKRSASSKRDRSHLAVKVLS